MPYNPDTATFSRTLRFVDDRLVGDEVTRSDLDAALDDLTSGVNVALSQALNFVGQWNPATGVFPASRPDGKKISARDAWVVTGNGTVAGSTFARGENLVALVSNPGPSYAANWLRVPSVTQAAAAAILESAEQLVDEAQDLYTMRRQTISAMRAVVPAVGMVVEVSEQWRGGTFAWREGNYSTQVAADTQGGVFVAANSVAASVGAWVRDYTGNLRAEWFGVLVGVPSAQDAAMQAAIDMAAYLQKMLETPAGEIYINKLRLRAGLPGMIGDGEGLNQRAGGAAVEHTTIVKSQSWTRFVAMGQDWNTANIAWVTAQDSNGYNRVLPVAEQHPTATDPFTEVRLFDATNRDAVGATPATLRNLKVAILVETGYKPPVLRNIEVIPSCPGAGETYGVSGYMDTGVPAYADYDIGILMRNYWEANWEGVSAAGYWREHGVLLVSHAAPGETATTQNSEAARFIDCSFRMLGMRGPDGYAIVDKTATQIWIRWFPGHQFAATGTISLTASDTTSSPVDVPYTALDYSTAAGPTTGKTGPWLVFTVASTAAYPIGGKLVTVGAQGGTTFTMFEGCTITNFNHQSFADEAADELRPYRSRYSNGLEVSGVPHRMITFRNCRLSNTGPGGILVGAAKDMVFEGQCYAEGGPMRWGISGSLDGPRGMLFIVGPDSRDGGVYVAECGNGLGAEVNMYQPLPFNDTVNMQPLAAQRAGARGVTMANVFLPIQGTMFPYLLPPDRVAVEFTSKPEGEIRLMQQISTYVKTIALRIYRASGTMLVGIATRDASSAPVMIVRSNDRVYPGITDLIDLGLSSARWRALYTLAVNLGSGGVTITSGAGTPEGVVSAPVGSIYTRTDGGASTTLYVKQSGTGNTGWVAK